MEVFAVLNYLKSKFSSEQERELHELRAAVARHQRIFHSSHGYGYFDWDLTGKKIDWSGGYWRYLGYTDEDVDYISLSSNYYDYVHPDDVQKLQDAVAGMLKHPGPGEVTYRTRRKKGGYIWTELRADSVRGPDGWVKYMSGIAFDVTKQRQTEQALLISEARHARILQSSNDGIWEWAAEHGSFYFANRCWEHLGFTDKDEVVIQGVDRIHAWRRRMHPDDGVIFDKALAAHIRGEAPFDVEYRVRAKDEKWRWIRARGQMTFNDRGEPLRMSGTNMDITELKLAEERVLNAKDMAEKANRAKSEFLASMTHELRTPLNAILGFAQLIESEKSLDSRVQEFAGEIHKAGEHLLQLIGDVLDLAKIEAGKLNFAYETLHPVTLMHECLALLKAQADARQVNLYLAGDELTNCAVTGDKVRLRQVFLNLVGNAIKYNRVGGKVSVQCSIEADNKFRVLVADTGFGIAKDRQTDVFQPFNRLGAELSNVEGSGVGLVITKQLVSYMGGHIDFASEPEVGSQFWVDLPLLLEDDIQQRPPIILEKRPAQLLVLENKRILYVEDNPSNQRLVTRLLDRYANLQMDLAGDALQGVYLARTKIPDLILMDINLPGMDGYDALEILKSDPITRRIPVVAVTANAMTQEIDRGRSAGFSHYLTKPLNLTQLIDVLNQLLGDPKFQGAPAPELLGV
jgi:PAS domain S-box-containing protein